MQKPIIYIAILTVITSFMSCVEYVDSNFEDGEQQIFLKSELTNSKVAEVSVQMTSPISLNPNPYYPELNDAIVTINNEELFYSGTPGIFRNPSIKIEAGNEYVVKAEFLNQDIDKVWAKTEVPSITDFKFSATDILSNDIDLTKRRVKVEVQFVFEQPADSEVFFQIIPSFQLFDLDGPNETDNLVFGTIGGLDNQIGFDQLIQKHGVFVDPNLLSTDTIRLSLEERLAEISPELDAVSIGLELRTITKEYYEYNLALSKQLGSNQSPISEDVISFTNVENGSGVFSSYSSKFISTKP